MNTRLRNQEVTAKPRIIANDGRFKVEWIGKESRVELDANHDTFDEAVWYANALAKFNKDAVSQVNEVRAGQRVSSVRKHMITITGVDPLNVDGYVAA